MLAMLGPDAVRSYQAAQARFSGSAAEQSAKANALLKSIFDEVYIGGASNVNQYPDINIVLRVVGVNAKPLVHHEHHFHIKMRVPVLRVIDGNSRNLVSHGEPDMFVMDAPAAAPEMTVASLFAAAQVAQAPAANAQSTDWTRGDLEHRASGSGLSFNYTASLSRRTPSATTPQPDAPRCRR